MFDRPAGPRLTSPREVRAVQHRAKAKLRTLIEVALALFVAAREFGLTAPCKNLCLRDPIVPRHPGP